MKKKDQIKKLSAYLLETLKWEWFQESLNDLLVIDHSILKLQWNTVLLHPKINLEQKLEFVDSIIENINIWKKIRKFLIYLINSKLIWDLWDIISSYKNLLYKENKLLWIKVISSSTLTQDQIRQIDSVLRVKFKEFKFIYEYKIEENIYWWIIIYVWDVCYNMSISWKLSNIKKVLLNK